MGKRTVPMKLSAVKMHDEIYYALDIAYDDDFNAVSETAAKERINRLHANIEKCGSYEKLREIGGAPTTRYINSTRVVLAQFFLEYVAANLVMDQAELITLKELIEGVDLGAFLKSSDWETITIAVKNYRSEFVNSLSLVKQN